MVLHAAIVFQIKTISHVLLEWVACLLVPLSFELDFLSWWANSGVEHGRRLTPDAMLAWSKTYLLPLLFPRPLYPR